MYEMISDYRFDFQVFRGPFLRQKEIIVGLLLWTQYVQDEPI